MPAEWSQEKGNVTGAAWRKDAKLDVEFIAVSTCGQNGKDSFLSSIFSVANFAQNQELSKCSFRLHWAKRKSSKPRYFRGFLCGREVEGLQFGLIANNGRNNSIKPWRRQMNARLSQLLFPSGSHSFLAATFLFTLSFVFIVAEAMAAAC